MSISKFGLTERLRGIQQWVRGVEPDYGAALDHVSYLTESPGRVQLLRTIAVDTPCPGDYLRDTLGLEGEALDSELEGLVERGWVIETDTGWQLTPAGEILSDRVEQLLDEVGRVDRLRPLVSRIPEGALDLQLHHLADAEVTVATAERPDAPTERLLDRLESADTGWLLVPPYGMAALETAVERARTGLNIEVVLGAEVAGMLDTDDALSDLREAVERLGGVDGRRSEASVPYFIGIFEDCVQIGVGDGREMTALAEATSDTVRQWAVETYQDYDRAADPML